MDAEIRFGNSEEKFFTLLNIPGQMYTLGSTYTSFEEQGQFLFCPFRGVGDPSHCVIIVTKGREFMVLPIKGFKTWINREMVTNPSHLQFGTKLTLGQMDGIVEDKSLKADNPRMKYKAVFKFLPSRYETKPTSGLDSIGHPPQGKSSSKTLKNYLAQKWPFSKDHSKNVAKFGQLSLEPSKSGQSSKQSHKVDFAFAGHHMVLERIFSYLPISDLYEARKVTSSWENCTRDVLSNRTQVNANCPEKNGQQHELQLMFILEKRLSNCPLSTLHIELSAVEEIYATQHLDRKFNEDLERFCKIHPKLKELGLLIPMEDSTALHRANLLMEAYCQGLERLDVGLRACGCRNMKEYPMPFPHSISFPKLKELVLHEGVEKATDAYKNWIQLFGEKVAHVTSVWIPVILIDVETRHILRLLPNFANLERISINVIDKVELKALAQLEIRLKHLSIFNFAEFEGEPEVVQNFEQLLEKHSKQLESLEFGILRTEKKMEIRLPTFKTLKSLAVFYKCIQPRCQSCSCHISQGEFNTSFVKLNKRQQFSYENTFPAIESLTIWPLFEADGEEPMDPNSFWTKFGKIGFLGQLFEQDQGLRRNIVESVKCLVVPPADDKIDYWNPKCLMKFNGQLKDFRRGRYFSRMFPNAENIWLRRIRGELPIN